MSGFSTYLQTAILGWVRSTAFPAAPAAVYVALFSADPTDAGSLTNEVTTTIRTAGRLAATFAVPTTNAGQSTQATNATVDFGAAAAGATITYFGIFDAATGGNMLYSNVVSNGGAVTAGTNVSFPSGNITLSAA